ncbi:MAG: hypothetical protein F2667_01825 [Actinobacteria bacterium]|uniref:Unannotated protein n=1 Tax=freshwater metagenome TaxID=449393 RepID=A0A6J6NZ25_9ZZZZ|nr:hypothetical protein [Actinomycetota bacterium]
MSIATVSDADAAAPRRVRHQAREAVALMAFSAGLSAAAAVAFLLLSSLGH